MNVRVFWVRVMKCMCAQTRPRFILSSERVLGGMEFEPMLTPREKSPLPENFPRGGSNPRRCGQRAQTLPTSYSGPLLSYNSIQSQQVHDGFMFCLPDSGTSDHEVPPGVPPETSGGHGGRGSCAQHCVSHCLYDDVCVIITLTVTFESLPLKVFPVYLPLKVFPVYLLRCKLSPLCVLTFQQCSTRVMFNTVFSCDAKEQFSY